MILLCFKANGQMFGPHFYIEPRYGVVNQPPDSHEKHDISELNGLLKRRDYLSVINDQQLFWLTFCKACPVDMTRKDLFSIKINSETLVITGRDHIVKNIKKRVEIIRNWFCASVKEKKNFAIAIIHFTDPYICKDSEIIDFDECKKVYWYKYFIKPSLPGLAQLLGMTGEITQTTRFLKYKRSSPHKYEADLFSVRLNRREHFVYPITPKPREIRENTSKVLYDLYKKQICCDIALVSSDKRTKTHSCMLYAHGGEFFQTLITAGMKETLDGVIVLDEFHSETIHHFVDFVYLGSEALLENVTSASGEVDVFELFRFANQYQIPPLIDCCTNLISLLTNKEDLDVIRLLSEKYSNEHLKELVVYLQKDHE